ncbi:hypothetical protein [Paenibacillus elgii]|uniref:hypothetical protein n=1 Tax=Paenibacillus elgii TaxID=189691 RepID=UPI000248D408|nr:hypothetical protein [Paenibacillus elgii]
MDNIESSANCLRCNKQFTPFVDGNKDTEKEKQEAEDFNKSEKYYHSMNFYRKVDDCRY